MRCSVRTLSCLAFCAAAVAEARPALAQTIVQPGGAPPADVAPTVAAPTGPADAPKPNDLTVLDSTSAAISAGGQFAAGNSRNFAGTGQGKFDMRRGNNAFGAALVGNYAEAFVVPPAGAANTPATPGAWQKSTENLQGKLRYDRFLSQNFSIFAQVTGTHDAFQAITFRLNADPGVKLLVINNDSTRLWGEAGYDFQLDLNYTDGNGIEQAGAGGPALDANNLPYVINKTDTIHSSRLFAGFHQAFNKEVQLNLGLEYLQGFGGSGGDAPAIPSGYTASMVDPVSISLTASRLNFDALLAAHLGAGLSVGVGFSAKYNSAPLPGKQNVDSTGTVALIYAFGGPPPAPPPACEPPPAPPAPPAAPATAAPPPAASPAPLSAPP